MPLQALVPLWVLKGPFWDLRSLKMSLEGLAVGSWPTPSIPDIPVGLWGPPFSCALGCLWEEGGTQTLRMAEWGRARKFI